MLGPGTTWYLAVSGVLFGIGAIGVMLRRSPLIVLLSLEIMLNASNLALVGFSRHFGTRRRPGLRASAVMAVAAAEVCVGLGLIVAFTRRKHGARRRHADGAARMIAGAWLCLLAPLAGALVITLAGTHISRSAAALDLDRLGVRRLRRRPRRVHPGASARAPTTARTSRPRTRGSGPGSSTSRCRSSSTRSR